ncbi:ATP-dependent nuclease [Granulicella tundricola]|uniref:ATP-dependent endonuclease n=1 Tax=Granulicella tundricola (strain ATCC BAA-1859 / DSM 23138 / MP5ACTX9) TaxID=1198114 RepID=E8X7Z8_GRATM|nr:AAA family ATPase [Granulicella tundricola]ADW71582.1 hypothetical protein AciX9_4652 [Granulicella tundricola MP5ACTX9]
MEVFLGDVVYLSQLTIRNFRKLERVDVSFQSGLNILVGPNNVGKTAVIDALRALLGGHDEPLPRLSSDDLFRSKTGEVATAIEFGYVFSGLDLDDEADFLPSLIATGPGKSLEAHFHIRYSDPEKSSGRLRVKRWSGALEENSLNSEMTENLRGVYLPPLRDVALGLRPSRSSQLARLIHILADEAGQSGIEKALEKLDTDLKSHPPIIDIQLAITGHHEKMLGAQLAQVLEVGLSASDFQRFSSRLSLMVDSFDVEQNGLGFNNLIFMTVVLSELARNPEITYRGLIVEEPEAHLHPHLQSILLQYLEKVKSLKKSQKSATENLGEKEPPAESVAEEEVGDEIEGAVQVFVTSHSPHFASIAKLSSLVCLVEGDTGTKSFLPRSVVFDKGKREKLERYLDVTRAELFFAKRIIFVEGAAELMLVSVMAQKCGYNLRDYAVSLISVEGLNFDCFLPLFGEDSIRVPVAVITDADPFTMVGEESVPVYPGANDAIEISANAKVLLQSTDQFIGVFHGQKTLEYDLALFESNRTLMLKALKVLHPGIGATLDKEVAAAKGDAAKAKVLFSGMFERSSNNVQKGRFGQVLAQELLDAKNDCAVPPYIKKAIEHVCCGKKA